MKLIKFDLPINGTKVRSLEELQDNLTTEILELYDSGVLLKWLKSRNLTEQAGKLSAMSADLGDVDQLVGLCEILGMDADRAVIEAALSQGDGSKGVALHADPAELKYKEKYERLSGLMEELKSKKLYLTQEDYNRFVKDKIQIEHEAEIECVALTENNYLNESFSFSHIGDWAFSKFQTEWEFRSLKKLGDVIEAGEVIGYFDKKGAYSSFGVVHEGTLKSPVRGILTEWSEVTQKPYMYKKSDPICHIRIDHETDPAIKLIAD